MQKYLSRRSHIRTCLFICWICISFKYVLLQKQVFFSGVVMGCYGGGWYTNYDQLWQYNIMLHTLSTNYGFSNFFHSLNVNFNFTFLLPATAQLTFFCSKLYDCLLFVCLFVVCLCPIAAGNVMSCRVFIWKRKVCCVQRLISANTTAKGVKQNCTDKMIRVV